MAFHRQPHDRKENMADDIRDWVKRINKDSMADLPTLSKLSARDLTDLMLAVHKANEAGMR